MRTRSLTLNYVSCFLLPAGGTYAPRRRRIRIYLAEVSSGYDFCTILQALVVFAGSPN